MRVDGRDQMPGLSRRPGRADVVVADPPVEGDLHRLAEGRRVDHLVVADVEPDMVHVRRGAVEDQVSGLQGDPRRDVRPGVVLRVRRARQPDAGRGIGGIGETRAVEAGVGVGGAVTAPLIGQAQLGPGERDGSARRRPGGTRGVGEGRALLEPCRAGRRVARGRRCGSIAGVVGQAGEQLRPVGDNGVGEGRRGLHRDRPRRRLDRQPQPTGHQSQDPQPADPAGNDPPGKGNCHSS